MKTTPGPWTMRDGRFVNGGSPPQRVATVAAIPDGVMLANGRLIAAAPELLAELEATRDWLESFSMPPTATIEEKQERLAAIEAVIAKATGS